MREGILHDILLEGQYCVTFRETVGETVTLSFASYPTKLKAIRAISVFQYADAWEKLAKV